MPWWLVQNGAYCRYSIGRDGSGVRWRICRIHVSACGECGPHRDDSGLEDAGCGAGDVADGLREFVYGAEVAIGG